MTRIFSGGFITSQTHCHSERSEESVFVLRRCFASLNMEKSKSKRIARTHLRPEQVQTWIRICLSAVGQMLVKRAYIQLPMVIHHVGNARRR